MLRRKKRNRFTCPDCGHDLRGVPIITCPECGSRSGPPERPRVCWADRLTTTFLWAPAFFGMSALSLWYLNESDWHVTHLPSGGRYRLDPPDPISVPAWLGTGFWILSAYVFVDVALHQLWRVWLRGPEWRYGGLSFYLVSQFFARRLSVTSRQWERWFYTLAVIPACLALSVVGIASFVRTIGAAGGDEPASPWLGGAICALFTVFFLDIAIYGVWRAWFNGPSWRWGGVTTYWAWRALHRSKASRPDP